MAEPPSRSLPAVGLHTSTIPHTICALRSQHTHTQHSNLPLTYTPQYTHSTHHTQNRSSLFCSLYTTVLHVNMPTYLCVFHVNL